jgi:hypothetical protein
MPANPVSPITDVKTERYVPGGGSNRVGDAGEDAEEEHPPMTSVQTIEKTVERIEPGRGTDVAHTDLFVIDIPSVFQSGKQPRKHQMSEKRLETGRTLSRMRVRATF